MPPEASDEQDYWFIALPDAAAEESMTGSLRQQATRELSHPSGRPWLFGRWGAGEFVAAAVGPVRVAVIGFCPVTTAELSEYASRVRTVEDITAVHQKLSGSFHLVAAVGDVLRVQGSASGLQRVYYSHAGGAGVSSNRADKAAAAIGAPLDETILASHLLFPAPPPALQKRSSWRGVELLPPGHYLRVQNGHGKREVRWWSPPEPSVPLASGAALFRQELARAVRSRIPDGATVSADLSGGLDSTSLCFLAASEAAHLITTTNGSSDPRNDDPRWALRATEELSRYGNNTHVMQEPADLPASFDGFWELDAPLDQPLIGIRDRRRYTYPLVRMRELGSSLHFCGMGGDEATHVPPSYLHSTVRRHPWAALGHLKGQVALGRSGIPAMTRALLDRRPYGQWLAETARDIDKHVARTSVEMPWGSSFKLPPWATPDAVAAIRHLVADVADRVEPEAPTRGQQHIVEVIRAGANVGRLVTSTARRIGVTLAAPFYDDRVIDAALSIRLHERADPWQYRPLMVTAMSDVLPYDLRNRATKGHHTKEGYAALRRHRNRLVEFFEDPIVARIGLVDADQLRKACLMYPPGLSTGPLEWTLSCEVWLRSVAEFSGGKKSMTGGPR